MTPGAGLAPLPKQTLRLAAKGGITAF